MKTIKKSLCMLLSIVMILGTVVVGFNGFDSTNFAKKLSGLFANEAEAAGEVTILVPETIYLEPNATSASKFQYYVNNCTSKTDHTKEALATQTEGKLYFSCSGTTDIIVKLDGVTADSGLGNTDSNKISSTGITDGIGYYTFNSNHSDPAKTTTITLSDGLAPGQSTTVKWTIQYKVSGIWYTTFAYSTVYAPYYYAVGATANGHLSGNISYQQCYASAGTWFVGVHGVSSTYSTYTSYAPNRATNISSGKILDPIIGSFTDPDNNNGGGWFNTTGVGTWRMYNEDNDYSSTGKPRKETSPYAQLYVDSSRYSNLNQIPNLKYGFAIFDAEGVQNGFWNVYDWTSKGVTSTGHGEAGGSGSGCATTGDELLQGTVPPDRLTASSPGCGIKVSGESWAKALGTQNTDYTKSYSIRGMFYGARDKSNKSGDGYGIEGCAASITQANMVVHGVNKTDLRTEVQKAMNAGYSDGEWAKIDEKFKAACLTLGQPDATSTECENAKDNLAATVSTLGGFYPEYAIQFVVPETIYLTPSTGNMSTFQYYLNNNNDGTAKRVTSIESSGSVYFNCDACDPNTGVTITCSGATINGTSTGNVFSSSTKTLNGTISSGSLSTDIATNTTSAIEWTATYTVNGQTFTAKNYTTCYAPKTGASSTLALQMSVRNKQSSTDKCVQTAHTIWCVGIHGFQNTTTGADTNKVINASMKNPPLTDSNVWSYSVGRNTDLSTSTDLRYVSGTGYNGWYEAVSPGSGDNKSKSRTGYYEGIVYYDPTRVTNLNQIPNLKIGLDLNLQYKNSDYVQLGYYESTRTTTNAVNVTGQAVDSNSDNGGKRYGNVAMNLAVGSTAKIVYIGGYTEAKANWDYKCNAQSTLLLHCTPVDKSPMREAYYAAINSGRQEEWYTADSWNTYKNALKTTAKSLGNVASSDISATGTLASAVSSLTFKTGVLKSRDVSTTGKVLEEYNDQSYNYGMTVSSSTAENGYTGYNFSSSKTERNLINLADEVNNTNSNPVNGANRLSYNSETNVLTFTTTSTGTDNYSSYPGPNTDISNYYHIPVTPGSTLKCSYTATGSTAQFYAFFAGVDKKTLPSSGTWLASKYETGDVSFDISIPSNCYYLTFRFGNQTAGGTTTFSNFQLYKTKDVTTGLEQSVTFEDNCYSTINIDYIYSPISSTATFITDGGTWQSGGSGKNNVEVQYDIEKTVSAPGIVTKTGYTFAGWKVTSAGGNWIEGELLEADETISERYGNVTFTAQWDAIPIHATYDNLFNISKFKLLAEIKDEYAAYDSLNVDDDSGVITYSFVSNRPSNLSATAAGMFVTDSEYYIPVQENTKYLLSYDTETTNDALWSDVTIACLDEDKNIINPNSATIYFEDDFALEPNNLEEQGYKNAKGDGSPCILRAYQENGYKHQYTPKAWMTAMTEHYYNSTLKTENAGLYFATPAGTKYVVVNFGFDSPVNEDSAITFSNISLTQFSDFKTSTGGSVPVNTVTYDKQDSIYTVEDSTIGALATASTSQPGYVFTGWVDNDTGAAITSSPAASSYTNGITLRSTWAKVANDDTFIMDFGTAATLDVLGNDINGATVTAVTSSIASTVATVTLKDGVITFTPKSILSESVSFTYTATYGVTTCEATVTIIPANNVYYEEDFVEFVNGNSNEWSTIGEKSKATVALKRAEDSVYGDITDSPYNTTANYSMDAVEKITVSKATTSDNWNAYAQFTFKGTGFDICSLTSSNTGYFAVYIVPGTSYNAGNEDNYDNMTCNTYSGYTYSQVNGEDVWTVAPNDNVIYHVPVISKMGLDYGTYTVRIYPLYSRVQDIASRGEYDFYFDSVRIYNPMDTGTEEYKAAGEYDAKYLEIRDKILEANSYGTVDDNNYTAGVAFIYDFASMEYKTGEISINHYKAAGPKNEVYLAPGQAISFGIRYTNGKPGKVAIGVRNLDGEESGSLYINNIAESNKMDITSTIDLFRDITQYLTFVPDDSNNTNTGTATVIIANPDGSDVNIALTKLKVTYASAAVDPAHHEVSAPARSMVGDPEATERTVELVFNSELFRSAVEQFFKEKPTIDVSEVNVEWEKTSVELGDPARLFITAPEKVTKVTVDGSEVAGYETLADGSKKWTFVTYGEGLGNKEFNVVAFVPDGEGDFVQSQSIGTGVVTFVKPVIDIKDAGIEFENDEIKLNETTTLNIETSTKVAAVYVGDTRYTDFDLKDGKRVFTVDITPEKTGKNDFVIKLESITGDTTETITKSITVTEYVVDSKGVTVKWSAGTIKQYESATLTVKTGENIVKVEADGKAMKLVKTENGEKTWEITYTEDKPGTKEVNIKLTDKNEMKSENIKSGKLTIRKLTFWERIVRFFKKLFGLI